jgi:hypothetical protein
MKHVKLNTNYRCIIFLTIISGLSEAWMKVPLNCKLHWHQENKPLKSQVSHPKVPSQPTKWKEVQNP